jgi:phosphatidylserine/phosphatidylglycerophosphate/cardiolipin synthase-like enzyme
MSLYDLAFDEAEARELEQPCADPQPATQLVPAPPLEPIGGISREHVATGRKRPRNPQRSAQGIHRLSSCAGARRPVRIQQGNHD